MDIKKEAKKVLSPMWCLKYGIKHHGEVIYIGRHSKIVNGKQMFLGNGVSIMPYCLIFCHNHSSHLSIGDNTGVGMFSRIGCLKDVEIGKNVLIGPHVFIADYNHEYRDPNVPVMYQGDTYEGNVVIGCCRPHQTSLE